MLVLSRKRNQTITIDEKITITVLEVRGKQVRLGIEAPREMAVHRCGAAHPRMFKVQGSMAKRDSGHLLASAPGWTLEFGP